MGLAYFFSNTEVSVIRKKIILENLKLAEQSQENKEYENISQEELLIIINIFHFRSLGQSAV